MTLTSEWRRERYELGPDLKLFRVRFDYMTNPRNQHTERMLVLEGGDSVQIVARTAKDEIVLVRQYRFGIGAETLELPGGIIDAGESPLEAARRELAEETGYTTDSFIPLGRNPSNPVFQSGWCHSFAAENVILDGPPKLDLGEDVQLELLPVAEVRRRLLAGEFLHPHSNCGLLRYFSQLAPERLR